MASVGYGSFTGILGGRRRRKSGCCDLGYLSEGELFVSGAAAAYGVPGREGEELILEVEVPRSRLGDVELGRSLKKALAQETGVMPRVVLLRAASQLPRTASGKLRRGECRRRFWEERHESEELRQPEPLSRKCRWNRSVWKWSFLCWA